MRNYIMLCRLENKIAEKELQHYLKQAYPHYKVEHADSLTYYGFPAREVPGVEDKVYNKLQSLEINDEDYVALYFKREENDEDFKQNMIIGHAEYLENDIQQRIGRDQHVENLKNLIEAEIAPPH